MIYSNIYEHSIFLFQVAGLKNHPNSIFLLLTMIFKQANTHLNPCKYVIYISVPKIYFLIFNLLFILFDYDHQNYLLIIWMHHPFIYILF